MSDVAVGLTADKVCDSALAFESVCRSEKGAGEILSGITARFAASRLVALVGADGAGKTTLMRIAAGILQPSAGHVLVFGEELYGKKLAHLHACAPGIMEATGLRTTAYNEALAYTRGVKPEDLSTDYSKVIPIGRDGKLDEVGSLVAYLVSDQASYITGTTVNISGGKSRG